MRRRSRAQQASIDRAFMRVYRQDALIAQRWRCCYCHEPLSLECATAEHIKPKSAGGLDSRDNIAAACMPCNKAKGSMSDAIFRNLIKDPPPEAPVYIWLIWSHRRIALATDRACKKISYYVGLQWP